MFASSIIEIISEEWPLILWLGVAFTVYGILGWWWIKKNEGQDD